ncbi:hypothetical protein [Cryptosporangium arvum]|uniref:PH domain-containing protein n=1 Tax=Cryptosporangium arvum DSM 44712 TaxID=927661 RepID=A0A011AK22_9ACTN|nr:hypothetical protein [Cryptosporangium arvum]EXG82316.1 hypothetical protein CryarDRAFT_3484 [Cryptosporangium arvum DSM 44712]
MVHRPWRAAWIATLCACVVLTVAVQSELASGPSLDPLYGVAIAALLLWLAWRPRIVLGNDEIALYDYLPPRRRIAWQDIDNVTRNSRWGHRGQLTLNLRDGTELLCPGPSYGLLRVGGGYSDRARAAVETHLATQLDGTARPGRILGQQS